MRTIKVKWTGIRPLILSNPQTVQLSNRYATESRRVNTLLKAARKKQPPLVLRLITMKFGRTPIYLVTSVLNQKELSGETARQLYQLRWGIEVNQPECVSSAGLYKLAG